MSTNLTSNELDYLKNEDTFLYGSNMNAAVDARMTQGDRLNAIKAQRRAQQAKQTSTAINSNTASSSTQQPMPSSNNYSITNYSTVSIDLK